MSLKKQGEDQTEGYIRSGANIDSGDPNVLLWKKYYDSQRAGQSSASDQAKGIALIGGIGIAWYIGASYWIVFAIVGGLLFSLVLAWHLERVLENFFPAFVFSTLFFILSLVAIHAAALSYHVFWLGWNARRWVLMAFPERDHINLLFVISAGAGLIAIISLMPVTRRNFTIRKGFLIGAGVVVVPIAAFFVIVVGYIMLLKQ